jgi:hypothetical protein
MLLKIYLIGFFISFVITFLFFIKSEFTDFLDGIYSTIDFFGFILDIIISVIISLLWPFFILILFLIGLTSLVSIKLVKLILFLFFSFSLIFGMKPSLDFDYKDFTKQYNIVKIQYPNITHNLFEIIYTQSKRNYLNPLLVCSLINAESNWNRNATSYVNARGLMQVMDFHLNDNYIHLYRVDINVSLGCGYLERCKNYSRHDLSETLRRYNQGINGRRKNYNNWKYVNKILTHYYAMIQNLNSREVI